MQDEAYLERKVNYSRSGGPYNTRNQMSRKEYEKLNPMFDRFNNIKEVLQKNSKSLTKLKQVKGISKDSTYLKSQPLTPGIMHP